MAIPLEPKAPTETPQTGATLKAPEASIDNVQEAEDPILNQNDFATFESAKLRIDKLISDFTFQIDTAAKNRDKRFKELDIEKLKKEKKISPNEFMIPMRIIDSNIRREQPAFFSYLKQSRRLVIFKDIKNPMSIVNKLEDEYTRGMTYSGWEIPHFKVVDGSQTHGWDSVEVLYDDTKPLHVGVEHIGNDNLIFPTDAINIQDCELILRRLNVTPNQLKTLVKRYNFNGKQVACAITSENKGQVEKSVVVYKCFFKIDGVVNVAWYCAKCSDWLLAPKNLFLGIAEQQETLVEQEPILDPLTGQLIPQQPIPTTQWVDSPITYYPIFILPYYETEQTRIIDHRGRVFLDNHKQEALTANISQFLNGCQKASTVEASVKAEVARQSEIQSIEMGSGKVSPIPLEYYAPPYPDSVMLQLQNYLDVANSQEAGQVNFAANNRKDSRKTATEIAAARDENAMLSSVQVSLYSSFIRSVNTLGWKITQSQALQGLITFLQDPETGENNVELIAQDYDIRAAGDVDVIKRQELIGQYKEFWPIIQTTPAAIPFLARLLKLVFLDEGSTYATILEQGDPRALIAQLAQFLSDPSISAAILGQATGLPPEQRQILIALLEQVKMVGEGYLAEQVAQNPSLADKINMQPGQQPQDGQGQEGGESSNEQQTPQTQ